MSLVSTYVLFSDGRYYKNPTIRGDGWFLCFDDDDQPELVVQMQGQSPKQVELRACDILEAAGIDATMMSSPSRGGRVFGKKIREAMAWFLTIHKPPPRCLLHAGLTGVEKPRAPCAVELCGGGLDP